MFRAFCPQHSDDAEKDERLMKKLWLYSWIENCHLDLKAEISESKIERAATEFRRINEYATPRDKLICILNGIRILEKSETDKKINADLLVPLIILTIIRSKPEKLYSNLQYISRFRNPKYLTSSSAYNLTTVVNIMRILYVHLSFDL